MSTGLLFWLLVASYFFWRAYKKNAAAAAASSEPVRNLSRVANADDADARDDEVKEAIVPAGGPRKPKHLRRILYDLRLLAKKKIVRAWGSKPPPKLMDKSEAARLFSSSLRTANRDLRVLAADDQQLGRVGLPRWQTEQDLARALEIRVGELRHYSIHRERERVSHYLRFAIPKRNGGERVILAPKRKLKALQRKLNQLLINRLPLADAAHGFRAKRSIATHAAQHVGKAVVVKCDLKDFFPSIGHQRVRGLLIAYGYSYPVAAAIALLCTESPRQPVKIGGDVFYVPTAPRALVQGAPTSPGLANALARTLDHRLQGLAKSMGFAYSRYADDLTFSGPEPAKARALLNAVQHIVQAEGFALNNEKTRVLTQKRAQRITGVTVNSVAGLSRRERRRLRAAIHQAQQRHGDSGLWARLRGKLAFVRMLNPAQARKLAERLPTA